MYLTIKIVDEVMKLLVREADFLEEHFNPFYSFFITYSLTCFRIYTIWGGRSGHGGYENLSLYFLMTY